MCHDDVCACATQVDRQHIRIVRAVVDEVERLAVDQAAAGIDLLDRHRRAVAATHLFEEPGTLEEVARLARDWFRQHLNVRQ